jgi:hypothetical protein
LQVRITLPFAGLLLLGAFAASWSQTTSPKATQPGNEACASCHQEIAKSYSTTVMAKASGPTNDTVITGEFTHKPSGVRYSVFKKDGRVWMSYDRPENPKAGDKGFHGQKELLYFIGSGVKGRTYLFSVDGFLFEAPINWYSQEGKWNMTPAFTEARESPMNLPAYESCMNCHTSGLQGPVAGTDSKFDGAPFAHDGITCERCHGVGDGHLRDGKGAIVNPAKLPAERRDAICMECHFEGTVAVEQPGKHLSDFQPCELLSDYEHYFLLSGNRPEKPEALSQFEALSLSTCKRKSGETMWCGSCHDPHKEPSASEKAAYYRGKCLSCHGMGGQAEAWVAQHHPEKPDCTACHMPQLPTKDVAHTETTDHRIMRYPNVPPLPRLEVRGPVGAPLVAFPASAALLSTTRDFALAWEALALHGVEGGPRAAENFLQKAVQERPEDPAVLSALAFVDQLQKKDDEAQELYQRALKADPLNNEAATNLGMIQARLGYLRQAAELWQGAFSRVPNRSAIGMNLAIAFCSAGQKDEARKYVNKVLEFNPDYGKAKSLLENMNKEPAECKP